MNNLSLKTAVRRQVKIKTALVGPSGSGKTYSALLMAYGLCSNWDKIAVIDTENGSADLYSHLGPYQTITLSAPFTPERYIEAIEVCEKAGMEVIIIDSISHEWEGKGGILEVHDAMTGNSWVNWSKVTPRHNRFIEKILQSNCHIIANTRAKQDYVLSEKNGKQVPEKVGLKGITREGLDYEFTIVFDLDIKHNARASKDRTGLFGDKPEEVITEETGKIILNWIGSAAVALPRPTEDTKWTPRQNVAPTPNKAPVPAQELPPFEQNYNAPPNTPVNSVPKSKIGQIIDLIGEAGLTLPVYGSNLKAKYGTPMIRDLTDDQKDEVLQDLMDLVMRREANLTEHISNIEETSAVGAQP